jgi:1-phosphofructokinase
MNISRALHRLKVATHAILLLGDDAMGRAYRALIAEEGFPIAIAQHPGNTRSDTIIVDAGANAETHLIEECAGVPQEGFEFVADTLKQIVTPGDVVVCAGELPTDAYPTTYRWLTDIAHEAGARVTLVTSGEPLELALESDPDLVMLRQVEMEAFFNRPVRVHEDVIDASRKLHERGADMVLVATSEEGGAVLVAEDGNWLVEPPEHETGTSSGVADALLAGFLAGRINRRPFDKALESAAAAAAYTASQPGNEFGSLKEVKELAENEAIDVEDIA